MNLAIGSSKSGRSTIQEGVGVAEQAREALASIVEAVSNISSQATEMAQASEIQKKIAEVLTATMNRLDTLTDEATVVSGQQAQLVRVLVEATDQMRFESKVMTAASFEQLTTAEKTARQVEGIYLGIFDVQSRGDRILQLSSKLESSLSTLTQAEQPRSLLPA